MSSFAKIENGIVVNVVVAEQDWIDTQEGQWVQTSYNTLLGVHRLGGTPLRKNFAGIGFIYDEIRDAFIPPKRYPSWILDEETCQWKAPKPWPDETKAYRWNEETLEWDYVPSPDNLE
jgi:hypothetical protein